jgi:t-SNARE complex subunit (syntaxin)
VIKEALISDNLKNVVQVIEERHLDILKLENQVLEIYELFRDLATLVDLQQESLDVIENRILKAKNYTEKAEVELNEAEEYQKKARAVSENDQR